MTPTAQGMGNVRSFQLANVERRLAEVRAKLAPLEAEEATLLKMREQLERSA